MSQGNEPEGAGTHRFARPEVDWLPHLHDTLGYSLSTAGLAVSLMTTSQLVGIVAGGYLGDRFTKRILAAACMGAHMSGLLWSRMRQRSADRGRTGRHH